MSVPVVPTEDYVLFADTSKSVRSLSKRMLITLLPIVFLVSGLSYFFLTFSVPIHSVTPPYLVKHIRIASVVSPIISKVFSWLPLFVVAEFVVVYAVAVNLLRKQIKPIVVLNSDGIQINIMKSQIGPIHWHEIEEMHAYRFMGYQFIGIIPKSLREITQRMEKNLAWLLQVNAACVPLYKPFGIFVAPINVPMDRFSISTAELLAQLRIYQETYQENANQFHPGLGLPAVEGTWPPPPRNEQ